jgi:NADP-dependent 3-hydroxy acid dehydrogenase YdfG
MDLFGKVAVLSRGTSNVSLALASRFIKEGAKVILIDTNELYLLKKSAEIKASAIVGDLTNRVGVKQTIEQILKKFARIDCFVSLPYFEFASYDSIFENDRAHYSQVDLMSLMYVVKYVFPQMIDQRGGYLVNMVPVNRLLNEFQSGIFSTLTHPRLSFSERMANAHKDSGIKVSVISSDIPVLNEEDFIAMSHFNAENLNVLVDMVITGMQQERFMISSSADRYAA